MHYKTIFLRESCIEKLNCNFSVALEIEIIYKYLTNTLSFNLAGRVLMKSKEQTQFCHDLNLYP